MRFLTFLTFMLLLQGCLADTIYKDIFEPGNKGARGEFDGDPEPPQPPISKERYSLLGVDSDNDGVRDDLEIWINSNLKTRNGRMAFKQSAKTIQKIFKYSDSNQRSIEKDKFFVASMDNAMECILFTLRKPKNSSEIYKLEDDFTDVALNTKARLSSFNDVYSFLDGNGATAFLGKDCQGYVTCNFDVQDLEKLKKQKYLAYDNQEGPYDPKECEPYKGNYYIFHLSD